MLSSSISNMGRLLSFRLIFAKKPPIDIADPVDGTGFLFFHFWDWGSMKEKMGNGKEDRGRLRYWVGVMEKVKLVLS